MKNRRQWLVATGASLHFVTWTTPFVASADDVSPSITACQPTADGTPSNCVSTASVRQVDLYAPPWTFYTSADEALARLKGALAEDSSWTLLVSSSNYLKVKGTRGLAEDQVEFVVNPSDSVITYSSKQSAGPSVADFGAVRRRLEELRRRAGFGIMGEDYASADAAPREGAWGQLKAFYGLRTGAGYERVLDDE